MHISPKALEALPIINAVTLAAPFVSVTTTGHVLFPERLAAPLLAPLPDGQALLLEDWAAADSPAYVVPASLLEDVRRTLYLSGC